MKNNIFFQIDSQKKRIQKKYLSLLYVPILFFSCKEVAPPQMAETAPLTDVTVTTTSTFVHPGIINDTSNLDFIRLQMDSNNVNRTAAYQQVLDFIDDNPIETTYPAVVMAKASGSTPSEAHIRRDAVLAYAYALKWARTGDTTDAGKAKEILNGWASNFERYEPVEGTSVRQCQLEAAWVAPSFVAAAEIIRHYTVNGQSAQWSTAERTIFKDFIENLKNNYINKMVKDINKGQRRNNWGISAGYAKMAIGVYVGSSNVYNDGKRIILDLMPDIIKADGEVHEYCARDCTHPQYSMSGLTFAAEIARLQGDTSLYEALSTRLKTGWEWMNGAYTGSVACRNCSTAYLFSASQVANNYYNSTVIQNLIAIKSPLRVNSGLVFLDFCTYTHSQLY